MRLDLLAIPGIIAIVVVVAVVVLLVVVLSASKRGRATEPTGPVASAAPAPSREERKAILEKLAQGEVTKSQAEEQLGQLGTPVPASMAPPGAPRQGCGKGCLVACLVAAILIPLIVLVAGVLFCVPIPR